MEIRGCAKLKWSLKTNIFSFATRPKGFEIHYKKVYHLHNVTKKLFKVAFWGLETVQQPENYKAYFRMQVLSCAARM